jgi:hypothetical protein
MKKLTRLTLTLGLVHLTAFAETNAMIEVKLVKDWVIKGERNFGNLAIKNTGTFPILLAKDPFHFSFGQLVTRPLPPSPHDDARQEEEYQEIVPEGGEFFNLLPEETHIYEGRKFYLTRADSFTNEMRFTVSVYLGKGFWLDSEPLTVKGVVPDSEEYLTTIENKKSSLPDSC